MEVIRGQYRQENLGQVKKGNTNELTVNDVLADAVVLNGLQEGELSSVVNLKDGSKAKLMRQGNDVSIFKVKDVLEIPVEMFGHKLTDNEKNSLINGSAILIKSGKSNLYLQVDKETNSITVKGDKDFELPKAVGVNKNFNYSGYELSDIDRVLLVNGHKTEQKLLCGDAGYFLAELQLTQDKKGVVFSNIASLTKKEAERWMEQNKSVEKAITPPVVEEISVEKTKVMAEPVIKKEVLVNESQDKQNKNEFTQAKSEGINNTVSSSKFVLDEQFIGAVKDNDFVKINEMAKNGYVPSEDVLAKVNVSEDKEVAINKIFGLNKTAKEKGKVVVQEEEKSKVHNKGSIKQAVTTMFNGM